MQSAIAAVEGAEHGGPVTVKGCVRRLPGGGGGGGGHHSFNQPDICLFSTHLHPDPRYAYAGGGRGIARVDVSVDGGKTWEVATLKQGGWRHGDYSRTWWVCVCGWVRACSSSRTRLLPALTHRGLQPRITTRIIGRGRSGSTRSRRPSWRGRRSWRWRSRPLTRPTTCSPSVSSPTGTWCVLVSPCCEGFFSIRAFIVFTLSSMQRGVLANSWPRKKIVLPEEGGEVEAVKE